MFRLIFLLCAGLFTAMLIAGQDHGQVRFGLLPENILPPLASQPLTAVGTSTMQTAPKPVAAVTQATYIPQAPLMVQPPLQPDLQSVAAAVTGKIMYVLPKSANVRAGPGTDSEVLERLTKGEAVLVVAEGPDGWSLIRIEGDGIEGYVATRLLTE